jgi:tRNA (Thr-GGU) A37 N-methylase
VTTWAAADWRLCDRSADRPNPVGLHRVKVLKIDRSGQLEVQDLEAIDGTR